MLIKLLKAQIMKATWYLMDKKPHDARAAILETLEIVDIINKNNDGVISLINLQRENKKVVNKNQAQLNHVPVLSAEDKAIFKDFLLPQVMCLLAVAYGKDPISRDEGTIYHEFTFYINELQNIKKEYVKAKTLREAEKLSQSESLLSSSPVRQSVPYKLIFDMIDAKLLTLIDKIELSIGSEPNSAKDFLCVIKLKLLQLIDENTIDNLQLSRDIAWKIAQLYKKLAVVINELELRDNDLNVNEAKKIENKALMTLLQNSALEYVSIFHQRACVVWIDFYKTNPDVNGRAYIYNHAIIELLRSYQLMKNNHLSLLKTMCDVAELAGFLTIPDVKSDGGILCKELIKHLKMFLKMLDELNERLHSVLMAEPEKLEYFKVCLYSLHDSQNKVRLKVEELESEMKKALDSTPLEQQQLVNQVVTPKPIYESLEIPSEIPELTDIDNLIKELGTGHSSKDDISVVEELSTPETPVDIESLSPGGSSDTAEVEKNSLLGFLPVPTIDPAVVAAQSIEYWSKSKPDTNIAAALTPSNNDVNYNKEDSDLSSWLKLCGNKENIEGKPNTPVSSPAKAQVSGLIRHGIHNSPIKRNQGDNQHDDAKRQKNTQNGSLAKREILHELTTPKNHY